MRSSFRFLLGWSLLAGSGALAAPQIPAVSADPAFTAPSPLFVGGFRFQTVDRGSRPDLFFGGVNLLLFKTEAGDQGAFWSFLSPGLQYQSSSERRISVSVAPASYVGQSGLAFALQVFPFDSGRTGGVLGFSVGYHFF
jgi:hypothetical protein